MSDDTRRSHRSAANLPHGTSGWIGVVLAGGRSRRMGEDKALLPHADPGSGDWLGYSLKQLVPIVDELWVVGRAEPDGPPRRDPGIPLSWIADEEEDAGPAGGLVTAARVAAGRAMIVVPCDIPGLKTNVLRTLQEALTRGDGDGLAGAAFADDQGRIQGPAFALLPKAYSRLTDAFSRGSRRLQTVLEACGVAMLEASPEVQKVLRNINSPSDREEFERKRDLQA